MMIDVRGAESFSREFLKEIVFFVRSAIRTDEADRVRAVTSVDGLKFGRSRLRSFFPGNGEKFVALAYHRLLDAIRVFREIETETALDAQEVAVDAAHVAVVGADNFVIANAERGLAAVRTVRANRGHVFHFPGPRFVAIRAAGQCADRTDVNAHAALFAFEVIAAVGDNHAIRAAHADAQSLDIHALIANANAAEAQDAPRSIVVNDLRPFFFRAVNFLFDEAAGVRAIAKDPVLQFALTAFIANREGERVIG